MTTVPPFNQQFDQHAEWRRDCSGYGRRTTMRPTGLRHDSDTAPRLRLLPEKWRHALFNVAHPLDRQQFEPHCQLRAVQAWLGKLTSQLLDMESLPLAIQAPQAQAMDAGGTTLTQWA